MYKFSKTSLSRLETCEEDLQRVARLAISRSDIDFGIAQGSRAVAQQKQYYLEGKSKVNPDAYSDEVLPLKGKHIVNELYPKSGAFDIYAYYNGKAQYDTPSLCYIGGVIMSCAKELGVEIRWGANWDMDGIIITDQSFQDLPHFELRNRTKK